jgi:RNA polymerase sigma-70 factor (ECF subfamily)
MRLASGIGKLARAFDRNREADASELSGDGTVTALPLSNAMAGALDSTNVAVPAAEAVLVERCKAGDSLAFDELISVHQERVLNTAFRLMGNYEEALDLTQEVFLNCFRKIGSFKGDSALSTWLYRITVNTAKNRWKYQQSRGMNKTTSLDAPLDSEDEERVKQFPDTQPTPRKVATDREAVDELERNLSTLGEEFREVMVLRYVEERSYEEISEMLGLSMGTVKSRIHRGRGELREKMKDYL